MTGKFMVLDTETTSLFNFALPADDPSQPRLATAAYWLHGRDAGSALYLLRGAHRDLATMAEAMGYTLTPKAADAVEVAA